MIQKLINKLKIWFYGLNDNGSQLEPKKPIAPVAKPEPVPVTPQEPVQPEAPPVDPVRPPSHEASKFFGHYLNDRGLDLIKEWEGLELNPYWDNATPPVATIGYGTIEYPNGVKVRITDPPITEKQATEFMLYELRTKIQIIDKHLRSIDLPLNSNQFSALISFSYNLGWGVITQPNRTMGAAILTKDLNKIAAAIPVYNKSGGLLPNKGLVNRRKAELALFDTPVEVRNV